MHRLELLCDCIGIDYTINMVWDDKVDFSSFWTTHGMSQPVNPCICSLNVLLTWSFVYFSISSHGFVFLLYQHSLPFPFHDLPPHLLVVCLPSSASLAMGVITAKWGSLVSPVVEKGMEVFLESSYKHLI